MLRAVSVVMLRIRSVEAELDRGADVAGECGMDLMDLCGRRRDQLVSELAALRRELAAWALLEQHGPGS